MRTNNILRFAGILLGLAFFLPACKNNVAAYQREQDQAFLDSVVSGDGSANVIITADEARSLKHNFDVWHRNRKYYDGNGNPTKARVFQSCEPGDDGDIPIDLHMVPDTVNDTLSKSVWFDKTVIEFLSDVISNTDTCDGVRIYFAAYDKMQVKSQHNPHQATVYLVPTVRGKAPVWHSDDYDIVPDAFQALAAQFHINYQKSRPAATATGNALNHGELCPDSCNTSGAGNAAKPTNK